MPSLSCKLLRPTYVPRSGSRISHAASLRSFIATSHRGTAADPSSPFGLPLAIPCPPLPLLSAAPFPPTLSLCPNTDPSAPSHPRTATRPADPAPKQRASPRARRPHLTCLRRGVCRSGHEPPATSRRKSRLREGRVSERVLSSLEGSAPGLRRFAADGRDDDLPSGGIRHVCREKFWRSCRSGEGAACQCSVRFG